MAEFILHVGPHKTGTTYLQMSFRAAREALRERGVTVAEIWSHAPGNPSQSRLAQGLREEKEGELRAQIADLAAAGCPRVLISAEDISNLQPAMLRSLARLLAGHTVRVVFYLRRWTETVPSAWQEGVKAYQVFTLPEFLLQHLYRPAESRLLNLEQKIAPLANIFGRDNLSLVSYSELRDRRMDIFSHFAGTFLGWPDAPPPLPALTDANASRDPRETELLRTLNAMARRRGAPAPDAVRRFYDKSRGDADIQALVAAMEPHLQGFKLEDSLPSLKRIEAEIVKRYGPRIVAPAPQDALFAARTTMLRYVAAEWVFDAGMSEAVSALYARMCAASV